MRELKIEVHGRVQGVRFRDFVKHTADSLRLKGYVTNRDDGSVLIIVQGDDRNLKKFLSKIQKGSMLSKVEGVSYFWRESSNTYDDFFIALDKGTISDQTRNFINLGKTVLGIKNKIPVHVAIIPDGNRRWAVKKGLSVVSGHEKSAQLENLISLVEEARGLGIKYVTFWAFSTENWKRNKEEVNFLFDLLVKMVGKFRDYAVKNHIRFRHMGRRDRLSEKVVRELEKAEEATKGFDEFNVQICIDYGGRDEITRAVNKILKSGVKEINEDDLQHYLDSTDIPDPDLIVRTSGENRVSGFMPFQSAYAELYFSKVHFPDFGPAELRKAVNEFGKRGRRFGK